MIAIPVELLATIGAVIAAAIVGGAVVEATTNIDWYVPGTWDLYEDGRLVVSDAEYGNALDRAEQDAEGVCVDNDSDWWLTKHGEPMSDGVGIVTGKSDYNDSAKKLYEHLQKKYGDMPPFNEWYKPQH